VKNGTPNGRPHLRWNLVSGFRAPFLRAKKAEELAKAAIASFHLFSINTWLLAASCRCPKELWSRAKKFARERISEGSDARREADSAATGSATRRLFIAEGAGYPDTGDGITKRRAYATLPRPFRVAPTQSSSSSGPTDQFPDVPLARRLMSERRRSQRSPRSHRIPIASSRRSVST
jgi:hypothetical protein